MQYGGDICELLSSRSEFIVLVAKWFLMLLLFHFHTPIKGQQSENLSCSFKEKPTSASDPQHHKRLLPHTHNLCEHTG